MKDTLRRSVGLNIRIVVISSLSFLLRFTTFMYTLIILATGIVSFKKLFLCCLEFNGITSVQACEKILIFLFENKVLLVLRELKLGSCSNGNKIFLADSLLLCTVNCSKGKQTLRAASGMYKTYLCARVCTYALWHILIVESEIISACLPIVHLYRLITTWIFV